MKRDDNEESISAVLKRFMQHNNLEDKMLETEIYQRWEELAGKAVNLKTSHIYFRKGVLTVKLTSATIRNEMHLRKTQLMENINMRLKGRPVRELVFK